MDNSSKSVVDSTAQDANEVNKQNKFSSKNYIELGMKAAVSYINKKGYDVLDTNYECDYGKMDIVSKQDDVLIFTDVDVLSKETIGFPKENYDGDMRFKLECIMAKYLQEHDYTDMQVRFDALKLLVLGDSKAFVRYHVNALGITGDEHDKEDIHHTKDRVTERARSTSKTSHNKNAQEKHIEHQEK